MPEGSPAHKIYDEELVFCVLVGDDFQVNSVIVSSSPLTQGYIMSLTEVKVTSKNF